MRKLSKNLQYYSQKISKKIVLFLIIFFAFIVRIFFLKEIPAELWGDVNEHFQYAREILQGKIRTEFWGGDGPMFDYLVAIFFRLFGYSFETVKLTTVFIGVLTIYFSYLLSKKLTKNKLICFLTPFLMSLSFWLISFSRQAKPYILVLLFVELFLYFQITKKFFLSGIILGIGLFTQAAFWGMMIFSFLNYKTFIASSIFIYLIFTNEIKPQIINNYYSYLGEKFGQYLPLKDKIINFLSNVYDNFQSYFIKGDVVFRHNIPYQPIFDIFSSIIFFIGLYVFFKKFSKDIKNRRNYLLLGLTFIFSQFSSFLDLSNPQNSPSFGRMIGSAFFLYFILALGIGFLFKKIAQKRLFLAQGFLAFYLIFYFIYNFYNYFFIYPNFLPNKNVPFGRIIASDIEKSFIEEKQTNFILYDCCWGEWGQPEPKSIENYLISYSINKKINFFHFWKENDFCNFLNDKEKESENFFIYSSPENKMEKLNCFNEKNFLEKEENSIFKKYLFLRK